MSWRYDVFNRLTENEHLRNSQVFAGVFPRAQKCNLASNKKHLPKKCTHFAPTEFKDPNDLTETCPPFDEVRL